MAEGKKSFTAYCDWITTFDNLTNEEAGILIKHLLRYVNDKNPVSEEPVVKYAFPQIQATLKRDLKKWEQKREQNKENARKRWDKDNSTVCDRIQTDATYAVSDSVSVSDSVNDIVTLSYKNESDFFKDWNETRTELLKTPSHVNRLTFEAKEEFRQLCKSYSREDFIKALRGLFRQKNLRPVMQTNPTHFLKFFENYLQAYHDKNTNVYGNEVK